MKFGRKAPAATPSRPSDPTDWPLSYTYFAEKIDDLQDHLRELREADLAAVAQALAAAEKADLKAEREIELWRENANNWRGSMDDREKMFVQNDTFHARVNALQHLMESQHKSFMDNIESRRLVIDTALADLRKSRDQAQGRQTAQTVFLGIVFVVVTVALRFLG